MKTRAAILVVVLALTALQFPALAADQHVRWDDIIGIIQAGNVVAGVTGGGQPWSTERGSASVNLARGEISFRVEGLVLAGGNSIGTRAAIDQVKGTLVCNAEGPGAAVLVDTPLVPLSAQGDAHFNGSVGALPQACFQPDIAFLIRIAADRWIANGAVRRP
jgi:hypothetical protein